MRRRQMLTVVMILLTALTASAQTKWVFVTRPTDHKQMVYARNVKRVGTSAVGWEKMINLDEGNFTISRSQYDCPNARYRTLSLTKYDADNNLLLSTPEDWVSRWVYVVPDSVGEHMLTYFCSGRKAYDEGETIDN
jgi:hypothetical protein